MPTAPSLSGRKCPVKLGVPRKEAEALGDLRCTRYVTDHPIQQTCPAKFLDGETLALPDLTEGGVFLISQTSGRGGWRAGRHTHTAKQ
jgi:hypothetical protein